MLPIRKIVCPTDWSPASLTAFDAACELAEHFDAEIILLHVVPFLPPVPPDLLVISMSVETDRERLDSAAQQLADIAATREVAANLRSRIRCVVKMGHAAHEISEAANEENAELIVIATHGLTGWRHLAFGSVAETVVRLAERPVLTIHTPQRAGGA